MNTHRNAVIRKVLVLCVFALVCGNLFAAEVRGRLLNQHNYPASGLAIRVMSQRIGPSNFTFSGPDGMYYLQGIPPGPYTLEVWHGRQLIRWFPIFVREPGTDIPPQRV